MNALTLKKIVSELSRIAQSRNPYPVLSTLKFDFREHHIVITASDLEINAEFSVSDSFHDEFTAVIDAKYLASILKTVKDKHAEIDFSLISDRAIKICLEGIDYEYTSDQCWEDFPVVNTGDMNPVTLKGFYEGIKYCAVAMSKDDSRFNLNTICVERLVHDTYIAMDGHRLQMYSSAPINIHQEPKADQFMIPRDSVNRLLKSKMIDWNNCQFLLNNKYLQIIDISDIRCQKIVTIRLLEGEYPNYRCVISNNDARSYSQVKTASLIDATKKLLPLTNKDNRGVNFSTNGSVKLEKSGSTVDVRYILSRGNEDWIINAQYLLDSLTSCSSENTSIQYWKDGAPISFQPDDCRCYSIIMPMRK